MTHQTVKNPFDYYFWSNPKGTNQRIDNLGVLDGKIIDINIMAALAKYVWYGLDPGSFTTALLCLNKTRCLNLSDSILRATGPTQLNQDPIENMMDFVREFPKVCWGTEYNVQYWIWDQGGATRATDSIRVHLALKSKWTIDILHYYGFPSITDFAK